MPIKEKPASGPSAWTRVPVSPAPGASPLPPAGSNLMPAFGMRTVAFAAMTFLVLVVFSRVVEYPFFRSLYLAVVSFVVAMVFLPFGGALSVLVRDRLSKGLLALTFLMLVAAAFGIFRSGSLGTLQLYWSRSMMVFFAVAGCVFTLEHFRRTLLAFSVATLALSVYSLSQGSETQGRIGMESGFFSNPNDLAAILMMAMPLIIAAGRSLENAPLRFLLFASTIFLWMTFLRTGSRGGFISMVVVTVALFFQASLLRKAQMVIVGILLFGLAVLYLPSATMKRFVVFTDSVRFAEFEEGEVDAYTAASSESRLEMASQGVKFTSEHPLFGLGAGNFKVASAEYYRSRNLHAPWTEVHNTFLQVSSENGIPALLIYVYLIVAALRRLTMYYRLYRESSYAENRRIAEMAWYLRLALVSYTVSAIFGNYAYQYHLPWLIGLTVALTSAEANRPLSVRAPIFGGTLAPPTVAQREAVPVPRMPAVADFPPR